VGFSLGSWAKVGPALPRFVQQRFRFAINLWRQRVLLGGFGGLGGGIPWDGGQIVSNLKIKSAPSLTYLPLGPYVFSAPVSVALGVCTQWLWLA
jgi:hypothetical protein